MNRVIDICTEEGFREAVQWTRNNINRLADGGVWVIPRSMTAVRVISHKRLEAEMIGMEREQGVVGVLRSLGWKVSAPKERHADKS